MTTLLLGDIVRPRTEAIQIWMIERLRESTRGAHFMIAMAVCFVAFLLYLASDLDGVLIWAGYLLICEAILGLIMLSRLGPRSWLRAYTAMHIVACAGWGILPIIFLPQMSTLHQSVYVMVVGAAAVVSQPALGYMPRLYLLGMLTMLPPLAITLLVTASGDDWLISLGLAIFLLIAMLLLTIRLKQNYSMYLQRAMESLSLEEVQNSLQVHQQKLKSEQLRADQAGRWDPVTGVRSQAGFLEQTGAQDAEAGSLAVCLKIAGFRYVNMAFGHETGNDVLRELASRLVELTGSPEKVCRTGGGEFLALITHRPDKAERKLTRVCERPCLTDRGPVMINAFIGIDTVQPGADNQQALLGAMHAAEEAKSAGNMRVHRLASEDRTSQRNRSLMRFALRDALDNNEFHLTYQPQHRLGDKSLTGFEALLRWHSPEFGQVSPADFIPVAEQAGLIVEVGSWVCQHAISEFCHRFSNTGLSLSLNVSLAQLESDGFVPLIRDQLERQPLEPAQLTLEITESIFMSSPALITERLTELRSMGVKIALDDFGTGYSSLSYLAQIPLDEVKIDRAFIKDLATSSVSRTLVISVLQICQALGVKAVLEGVEESGQAETLRAFPDTLIQGFLYSRPIPIASAAAYASSFTAV